MRFGRKNAARIAIASIVVTLCSLFSIYFASQISALYPPLIFLSVLHAIFVIHKLKEYIKNDPAPKRIDGLIVNSLFFIFWFILIPIFNLLF